MPKQMNALTVKTEVVFCIYTKLLQVTTEEQTTLISSWQRRSKVGWASRVQSFSSWWCAWLRVYSLVSRCDRRLPMCHLSAAVTACSNLPQWALILARQLRESLHRKRRRKRGIMISTMWQSWGVVDDDSDCYGCYWQQTSTSPFCFKCDWFALVAWSFFSAVYIYFFFSVTLGIIL